MTGGGEIGLQNDLSCTQFLCTVFLSEILKDWHFAEKVPLKKGVNTSFLASCNLEETASERMLD